MVDGKAMPHNPALAAGVNLNDLGFGDPTRGAHANVWIDWVSGAAVRQGLPARIERVQADLLVRPYRRRPRGRRLFSFAHGFLAALARANPR